MEVVRAARGAAGLCAGRVYGLATVYRLWQLGKGGEGMPIIFHFMGEFYPPVIECDWCGSHIEDIKKGCYWYHEYLAQGVRRISFMHVPCFSTWASEEPGDSQQIQPAELADFLRYNLAIRKLMLAEINTLLARVSMCTHTADEPCGKRCMWQTRPALEQGKNKATE